MKGARAEFNPFAGAAEAARAGTGRGWRAGGAALSGTCPPKRGALLAVVLLFFCLLVTGAARAGAPAPAITVDTAPEPYTAEGQHKRTSPDAAFAMEPIAPRAAAPPPQAVRSGDGFLTLPEDTARLIVQVNGCRAVAGVHDDPGVAMLAILPSVAAGQDCTPHTILLYASLTDFPSATTEGNLPSLTLAGVLRGVPERIDITDIFFNPTTRVPRAFSAAAFSRALHVVTSVRLEDGGLWATRLAAAGYTIVAEDSGGTTWRTDAE
eukprot:TRINITY_DN28202_c0_g1_i1.p1 TRINITY_DN28202_c0_g1~~TRINITY_DN28202_c0_g1_i1.p1  ORF type:complete len:266 (+),score=41.74 TRINITY_DN28202_c0_g1_i1:198-995(+)